MREKVEEVLNQVRPYLQRDGGDVELIDVEEGARSPAGTIIDQRPAPKTEVKKGTSVRVVVSGGPVNVVVPDLRGLTRNEAKVRLEKANLRPGEIASIQDAKASVDLVLATEPPAGATAVRNATVNLLVSVGPPPAEISMPRLMGKTPEEAENQFAALGLDLRISEIQEQERPDFTPGVICDQTPKPGTRVHPEAAVMVTVAKNPG